MFRKITPDDFQVDPYPHIVIDGFMEDNYFNEAMLELQAIEASERQTWTGSKNRVLAPKVVVESGRNECFPELENYPMVKKIMEYFNSDLFYEPLINEWSKYFPSRFKLNPGFNIDRLSDLKGTRLLFDAAGDYVPLRDAHIDNPRGLIVWQFYFRLPSDSSTGGDFTIYSYKRGFRGFKINTLIDVQYLSDRDIELEKTIPFKSNTLIILLSGMNSIHGVTNRKNAEVSRIRFAGSLTSEDCRLVESMNGSAAWKFLYNSLRLGQRIMYKIQLAMGHNPAVHPDRIK
jgi:hypothetical protein